MHIISLPVLMGSVRHPSMASTCEHSFRAKEKNIFAMESSVGRRQEELRTVSINDAREVVIVFGIIDKE